MKKFKKFLGIALCLLIVCSTAAISAFAVSNDVDLIKSDTASYSDSYFAYGGYINSTTKCHAVSNGLMRAQCEYRKSYSLNWISDIRIFIEPGKSAPTTYSSRFTSGYHWRLALSRKDINSSVSGVGTIYYIN